MTDLVILACLNYFIRENDSIFATVPKGAIPSLRLNRNNAAKKS